MVEINRRAVLVGGVTAGVAAASPAIAALEPPALPDPNLARLYLYDDTLDREIVSIPLTDLAADVRWENTTEEIYDVSYAILDVTVLGKRLLLRFDITRDYGKPIAVHNGDLLVIRGPLLTLT
jgi:hypothetical protein